MRRLTDTELDNLFLERKLPDDVGPKISKREDEILETARLRNLTPAEEEELRSLLIETKDGLEIEDWLADILHRINQSEVV